MLFRSLPHEAGLGAASADAAAILRYLWEEYSRPISFDELLKLGEGVGADVPFCLVGGTALAMGKGEILKSVTAMPDCEIVVIKPPVGASTPKIFAAFDNTVPVPENPNSLDMITALESGNIKAVAKLVGNCLETSTGLKVIEKAKRLLASMGALGVSMTGSGSAVFGIFEYGFDTREVCNKALEEGYITFSCKPQGLIK